MHTDFLIVDLHAMHSSVTLELIRLYQQSHYSRSYSYQPVVVYARTYYTVLCILCIVCIIYAMHTTILASTTTLK